jgi:hypothetical protein
MTKPNFKEQAVANSHGRVIELNDTNLDADLRADAALKIAEEEYRLRYAHHKAEGNEGRAEAARKKLLAIRTALHILTYGLDEEPVENITSPSGCKIIVKAK